VPGVIKRSITRFFVTLALGLTGLLVASPFALGADGVGLGGPADDQKVTYWAFGVMIFFVLVVIIGSLIQIRLEARKERLQADLQRVHRPID
jgi:membrane protease YdiL (CAAX protease family)